MKLPSPLQKLKALSRLQLKNCRHLSHYDVKFFDNLPEERLQLQYLRKLYLDNCGLYVVPHCVGCLSALEALDLSGNPFREITSSLNGLFELQYLGVRNCIHLRSLPELPPNLAKLDAHGCHNLSSVSMDPKGANGNIFEFIFTSCYRLDVFQKYQIQSYALAKFQLYAKRLYNQVPSILVGESSFCFPRSHNNLELCELYEVMRLNCPSFGTEIQLPSGWSTKNFLGFVVCGVILFKGVSGSKSGFRVKCRFHFQNENGEFNDHHSYFGSWYDTRIVNDEHLFFGYDPCLHLANNHDFDKFNKVSIQFWLEDITGNPLKSCSVLGCGATVLTKYTSIGNLMLLEEKGLYSPSSHVSMCLSGNEVPEWFNYQGIGCSIKLQLPPHRFNNRWMGFAICVLLEAFDDELLSTENATVFCDLQAWNNKADEAVFLGRPATQVPAEMGSLSHHLWFNFMPSSSLNCENWWKKCGNLKATFHSNGLKVKYCGLRIIYGLDVAELLQCHRAAELLDVSDLDIFDKSKRRRDDDNDCESREETDHSCEFVDGPNPKRLKM
ncbi:disease resistance-like protein DSC1 [Euphorbia lathyris]|uniref:disease resistance-like protein DSC1 n=1 Tax=Euphorbia lathyris TaxID=212925 RepID=UPI0033143E28